MSLSIFFTLTLAPFLFAWLLAEGVKQYAEARKLARTPRDLRR